MNRTKAGLYFANLIARCIDDIEDLPHPSREAITEILNPMNLQAEDRDVLLDLFSAPN